MLRFDPANDPFPNHRHEIILDAEKGITMGFRWIPPGRFRMGSRGIGLIDHGYGIRTGGREEPVHDVEITRGYWMAETPLTQAQFGVWLKSGENHRRIERAFELDPEADPKDVLAAECGFPGNPDHPRERVYWYEARDFSEWLGESKSLQKQLPSGVERGALPTEAQWERACRGPDDSEKGHLGHHCDYYNGDGEAALAKVGWYQGNAGGTTHEVGLLDPNGWGLYDLHGNVWEWCQDLWHESPYVLREEGCQDPVVTEETPSSVGTGRVVRGGTWGDAPRWCRSACRDRRGPTNRNWLLGFRTVLLLSALPGPAGPGPAEPRHR